VVVVASANPEDYTNRGRITPLKDRFGAEIRTHYPLALAAEVLVITQSALLPRRRPITSVPGAFARNLRESQSRSALGAFPPGSRSRRPRPSPRRRGTARRSSVRVSRSVDLATVIDVLRGKLEFESGEEDASRPLEHLLRRATADTAQRLLPAHHGGRWSPRQRGLTGHHGRAGLGQGCRPRSGPCQIDAIAERSWAQTDGETRCRRRVGTRGGAVPGSA
jgi:magnesium chelatase subunit I